MIVKNESKIIARLFDSVVEIIDSYCICDTGSTDNTAELIKTYFQSKQIPGRVVIEPFKNFEHNRTFALRACENNPEIDFILLMDADMVLVKGPEFDLHRFKQQLNKADVFHLFQGSERFSYKNVRIVKNNMNIKYWGVTHEVINTPDGTKYDQFDRNMLFIEDIGDGGAKADKFERDIRLLTQGLVENPNNGRYIFYLANSYRDHGNNEKAIEMYKKRIEIGGWFDEVWHSYFSIGRCYKSLGNMDSAIAYWMLAYDYFPKRLENLYEIIKHYRCESKHKLVYEFYKIAIKQLEGVDKSKIDYLFLQNDVYDYKIDYEYSIVGYYYNPDNIDLAALSMHIISAKNIEDSILKNVLANYKFYCASFFSHEVEQGSDNHEFKVSTQSLCLHNGEIVYKIGHANTMINKTEMLGAPRFFELFRGSTNGIRVGDETWFIAHAVSYEDHMYYYHILVAIDIKTNTVKRWSRFFTLNRERIEYVLGFIQIDDDNFMIEYSTMDKTSNIRNVSKTILEGLFL